MDDLVGRWVAGDARAAEELYRTYYDRVRRFAVSLGSRLVDAEDIAQEAMIAGLEGLRAGRRPDRLTLWLLGIARHVAAAGTRMVPRDVPQLPDAKGRSARTHAVRREMGELLQRSLGELPESAREVLDLLHREGLSRKEAADRLGLDHQAVHARCERAYARLREALSRHFTTRVLGGEAAPTLERIRSLRPAFRQAVVLRHLDGLSEAEAAARLGVPQATVRARLGTAYEILKCGPDADFGPARAAYEGQRREGR
jgi:RNA polymerase sigma-70 factor (ECF subfamily)